MSPSPEQMRADLYLISMARQMRDSDVLHIGAAQQDVWLAAEVAKLLWAPRLRFVAAGSYHFGSLADADPAIVSDRTYGRDVIAARQATFLQSQFFHDMFRNRVVFSGALQLDARGNGNLIGFMAGDKYVRGPGSAGLPSLTSHSERFFFALPRHNKNVLVQTAYRITVLGDPVERERLDLPRNSLQQVITPLATFRPHQDGLELVATCPGIDVDEVRRETGFEIRIAGDFAERSPLNRDECDALALLRKKLPPKRSA